MPMVQKREQMTLQHIVLYECDGPNCLERGSPSEVSYHGKFPKGWLHLRVAEWPNVQQGQAGGLGFHTYMCMVEWLLAHVQESDEPSAEEWDRVISFLQQWKEEHDTGQAKGNTSRVSKRPRSSGPS